MTNRSFLAIFIMAFAIAFTVSCSSGNKTAPGEESTDQVNLPDVNVEAYLFDVKLRRKGKPTTVRLDIYQTDSVVAMYGRGYFNKGAFRGQITSDSMLIYFPSTNEFLNESNENLFNSFDCETELTGINLLSYFESLPDSGDISENLRVETIEESSNSRQLRVSSINCPWRLLLGYRKETNGWRLELFEFDDGSEVTLKGKRRNYKDNATVTGERFQIPVKPDAHKITL